MPRIDSQHGRKAKPRQQGPPSFPSYVPPKPGATKPKQAPRPTPKQLESARAIERSYQSQGTAVKRASTEQKTGVTRAQSQRKPSTPVSRARAAEREYKSQGAAVARDEVTRYLTSSVDARRKAIREIKAKPAQSPTERNILRIHSQRQAADARQRREIGYLPRAKSATPALLHRKPFIDPNTGRELDLSKPAPGATAFNALAKAEKEAEKPKEKGLLATVSPTNLAKSYAGALAWEDPRGKIGLGDLTTNAIKDAADLTIGAPTTTVKAGVTHGKGIVESVKKGSIKPLAKADLEIGKSIVEPYKELYKNPKKFATEHPVSTALMVSPARAIALRGAGRLARAEVKVAGKTVKPQLQSLKRPDATLPGTTLRQQRTGHRDIELRARQAREDKANPKPQITTEKTPLKAAELDRRVDETFDANLQQQQRARASALEKEVEKHPLTRKERVSPSGKAKAKRKERRETITERLRLAGEGARQEGDRRFAREYGSHLEVRHPKDPKAAPQVYEPKDAPELGGKLHASQADAEKVAEKLRKDPKITWEPHVMKVTHVEGGDAWAVVPEQAHTRFTWHKNVGTSEALGAVNRRVLIKLFKKSVLPTSPGWLLGQAGEAVVRNIAHGSGVGSYIRARRVLKRMPKAEREELLGRTVQPAQFGATGPTGEFVHGGHKTLAEEYAKTPAAKPYMEPATELGKKPGIRHLRAAHRRYSSFVFNDINGTIERLSKTAMLGKEIKKSPLMEKRLLGLTDKAMQEAADGLHGTAAQVEMGRALNRAYGKYSQMSPAARETIAHQTPFLPWFLNMVEFNRSVMPRDHPVKTGLYAAYTAGTEEWRKQHHLSYHDPKHVPDWMMGSYPAGGGNIRVGRFGPFVPGEPVGAVSGQFSPMFQGILMNAAGVDWTGKELKGRNQGQLAAMAGLTAAETFIPGVSQLDRVTGLGKRYVQGKKDEPVIGKGKKIDKAVLDILNPVKPIKPKPKKAKGKSGYGKGGYGSGYGKGGYGSGR